MKKNQFDLFLFSTAGVAVCFVIVIGINIIAGHLKHRWDLTENKLFTLSEGTKSILRELDSDVEIRLYATRDAKLMPPQLKNYVGPVEDLIDEFERHNPDKIHIKKFDPQPDSDAEDLAANDGIRGQMVSMADRIYLGLAISMLEELETIPFLDPSQEQHLEYEIARAISQVATAEKPVVGVMSSLPVFGENTPNPMMSQLRRSAQEPWIVVSQLRRDFEVRRISMTADSIDEDVKVLLVIHPKKLGETTEYALDQFVLRGGKLIAFLDSFAVMDQPSNSSGMMGSPPSTSNLDRLLPAWGLSFDMNRVVADMTFATRIPSRRDVYPSVLSINDSGIHREDIATSQIDDLQFIFAGAFSGTPIEGLDQTILIHTTEKAHLIESSEARKPAHQITKESADEDKEYPLALRLTGKFKTAFPEGKPKSPEEELQEEGMMEITNEDEEDEEGEGEESEVVSLTESEEESSVVLFGDADFIFDGHAVRVQEFMGRREIAIINGNLPLIQNVVEHFSGDNRLIRVRSRAAMRRPFKKVHDMRAQAEEKYSSEIENLEKKLEATQEKLNELQSERGDSPEGQQFVLTSEQQAELENFRKQEKETNKELKDTRRNLRRAIVALETKLKWLNIAAMPAIITIGGILIALIKRKRTAAR